MGRNKFVENLPWIAPTAAIVLAASGYLDSIIGSDQDTAAVETQTVQTPALQIDSSPKAPSTETSTAAIAAVEGTPVPRVDQVAKKAESEPVVETAETAEVPVENTEAIATPEPVAIPEPVANADPEIIEVAELEDTPDPEPTIEPEITVSTPPLAEIEELQLAEAPVVPQQTQVTNLQPVQQPQTITTTYPQQIAQGVPLMVQGQVPVLQNGVITQMQGFRQVLPGQLQGYQPVITYQQGVDPQLGFLNQSAQLVQPGVVGLSPNQQLPDGVTLVSRNAMPQGLIGTGLSQPQAPVVATPDTAQTEAAPVPDVTLDNAADFFADAQAKIAAQTSCVDDLRALSNSSKVYFPSGGLTADEAGIAQARLIGTIAQHCPNVMIMVEGHSDPSGNPEVNLRLSQQRAEAVLQRIAASGLDVTRFRARGFGSSRPSAVQGDATRAYYDRRVEFSVTEIVQTAGLGQPRISAPLADCVTDLKAAVSGARLFYGPRAITAQETDLVPVLELARKASECPEARLRVIGQYADSTGSGETPATARLRAIALMGRLVASGVDSDEIILAAPSRPTEVAGQPGLSSRRVDFDVIIDSPS